MRALAYSFGPCPHPALILNMLVSVALFEIHIPYAQSLKEKRMVVKGLRDRIRNKFEVSVAEVALQELHQRARLGIAIVTSDGGNAETIIEGIVRFVESHAEATLTGWQTEMMEFEDVAPLGVPNIETS